MAACPVHTLSGTDRLAVVLQYPKLDAGPALLVAPLYPAEARLELEGVTPRVEIAGKAYLVANLMAAVHQRDLGAKEGSLTAHEYPIANAINRLFFGI
jgi:hypothetical protein